MHQENLVSCHVEPHGCVNQLSWDLTLLGGWKKSAGVIKRVIQTVEHIHFSDPNHVRAFISPKAEIMHASEDRGTYVHTYTYIPARRSLAGASAARCALPPKSACAPRSASTFLAHEVVDRQIPELGGKLE